MSLSAWIPKPLLELGPWDLAWWQWIAVIVNVLLAMLIGRIAVRLVSWALRRVATRTTTTLDDDLLVMLAGPLRLLAAVLVYRLALPLIELPDYRAETITHVLLAVLAYGVVWGVLRAIDVLMSHAGTASWAQRRPASRALLSLIGRTLKVVVVIIAAVSFLGAIGLPIASLLAGLGIGGIAIAFGAQKTVENLFGAFALGVDQPLREGDSVKIEADLIGTVESVGLRSTRVRTPDRTIVTLPNGRLADMKIETFAARDRCRFATTLGLTYGTTASQLRAVTSGIESTLRKHPKIWTEDLVVRFMGFGQSSLDLEVVCWFQTSDYQEFRAIREEILVAIMELVERSGSAFAFPTRTIRVASVPSTMSSSNA
jgi:MscS family membrane protein